MAMVVKANAALQARYAETKRELRRMGLTPNRIASQAAMGGPLEEVNENNASAASAESGEDSMYSFFSSSRKFLQTGFLVKKARVSFSISSGEY